MAAACQARGVDVYECRTTVENERDMLKAVDEVKAARLQRPGGVPGQLRPRDPRDLIAQKFDGPVMYAAAPPRRPART